MDAAATGSIGVTRISPQGLEQIIMEEAEVLHAYQDKTGTWTIGVGHTDAAGPPKVKAGMKITKAESRAILRADLERMTEPHVIHRMCPRRPAMPTKQNEFDAGCSFCFNVGPGNFAKATWVDRWKEGNREATRAALLAWDKSKGQRLSGLTARRGREFKLLWDGTYDPRVHATPDAVPHPVVWKGSVGDGKVHEPVRELQAAFRALGLWEQNVNGVWDDALERTVLEYQKAHPNLLADAKVGPATRAQIERELKMRENLKLTGATAAAATAAAAGVAAVQDRLPDWVAHVGPFLWPGVALIGILALVFVAYRFRDELAARLNRRDQVIAPVPDEEVISENPGGETMAIDSGSGVVLSDPQGSGTTVTLKGWKMMTFNFIVVLFGALQAMEWVNLFPQHPQLAGGIAMIVGAVNMALRSMTTTPAFQSRPGGVKTPGA